MERPPGRHVGAIKRNLVAGLRFAEKAFLATIFMGAARRPGRQDRDPAPDSSLARRRLPLRRFATMCLPQVYRGGRRRALSCLMSAGLIGTATPVQADDETELSREIAEIGGQSMEVYVYRPADCVSPSFLFVFHGNGRGARSYGNSAREIADRACLMVFAPLFDEERFSSRDYHRGGVVDDGQLKPRDEWTTGMVADLIRWAEAFEGRTGQEVYLFGHSAGGQFLSRVAAYDLPEGVGRVVIANPSTYVLPTTEEEVPYGFSGLPDAVVPELTREYLAAPVTIFLGEEDTGDEDLARNDEAERQGVNRLDRGQRTFEMARKVAEENGWAFNWRLVHAEDVGHSGRGMLQSDYMIEALR